MPIGIDPKVDYAFKHLLGRETTKPILTDVIEKVLGCSPIYHLEIELLNPFNPKEKLDDKLSILDVKARDQDGRQFNLEMQMLAHPYYDKRILYYAAKLHQQQLQQGEDYLQLRPTISISFLNHVMFPELDGYHLRFQLLEQSRRVVLTSDLEFHVLELPKFTKAPEEIADGLDIWLYFLRHAEMMDLESLPAKLQQPLVIRALEELKMLNQTDTERELYEARRKAQLDYNTGVKLARSQGRMEGRAQELVRIVQFCQRLLKLAVSSREELTQLPIDDLNRLAENLEAQSLNNT